MPVLVCPGKFNCATTKRKNIVPQMKIRYTQMERIPLHFICVHLIFICGKNCISLILPIQLPNLDSSR